MPLNPLTLVPASSKAKDVATLADLPTHTSGTIDPVATTEPIGSTYHNTTDDSIWTYTASGWVLGGDPDALTDANFNTNITTIDGGKITTGIIRSPGGSTYFDLVNDKIEMNGGTITSGTITSGTIHGVNITGSIIKSSWIDYRTVGALTNWVYYGPPTNHPLYTGTHPVVPVAYAVNFAANNLTGELEVDSDGYVRLPAVSGPTLSSEGATLTSDTHVYASAKSYNSYLGDYTTVRCIKEDQDFFAISTQPIIKFSNAGDGAGFISNINGAHITFHLEFFDGVDTHVYDRSDYHIAKDGASFNVTANITLGTLDVILTIGSYIGSVPDSDGGLTFVPIISHNVEIASGTVGLFKLHSAASTAYFNAICAVYSGTSGVFYRNSIPYYAKFPVITLI